MTVDGREVIWNEEFLTNVAAIQQYISEYSPLRGRTFSSEILDYTLDVIAPNPFAFVKFDHPKYQVMPYRRAVFRKNHLILYKVEDARLTFLAVYHTSRNTDGIVPEP